MRKIEQQMLAAIIHDESWQSGNTAVTKLSGLDEWGDTWRTVKVYLHGHEIAEVLDDMVAVNVEVLIQHPTRTTCSRLRALGVPVSVKQGVPYLGNVPADAVAIPFYQLRLG